LLSRRIVYGVDSSNIVQARESGLVNMILDNDSAGSYFTSEVRSGNPRQINE